MLIHRTLVELHLVDFNSRFFAIIFFYTYEVERANRKLKIEEISIREVTAK